MTPVTHNITIYQGATFSTKFYVASANTQTTPRDLTGYSARMQLRKSEKTEAFVIELSTENGRINIGPDHRVNLSLSALETASIPAGQYVYDIELISGSTVNKPLRGRITVIAEVTR